MILLFSHKYGRCEKEITEIISKIENLNNNNLAILLDKGKIIANKNFPTGTIGICEDSNRYAINMFSKKQILVITCGMNQKNTITCSSINDKDLIVSLQRSIIDLNGNELEPTEYKIKLKKGYLPFSVMACTAIILLCGEIPNEL